MRPAFPIPGPPAQSRSTGKERDSETGLDYFGARYYGSTMGRWLSPDEFTGGPVDVFGPSSPTPPRALPYADIANPQSLNKYAYAFNNPLRYIDPDGHKPGDKYKTVDDAGRDAIKDINDRSIKKNKEYAGVIYKNKDGSYSYTKPKAGSDRESDRGKEPKGTTLEGDYHTHGNGNPKGVPATAVSPEKFSDDDRIINWTDSVKAGDPKPGFLGTPSGETKKFTPDPSTGSDGGKVEKWNPKPNSWEPDQQ